MKIRPRYGGVGRRGSISVVERFHRTQKEILRQTAVPEEQAEFEEELAATIRWYNEVRPHETLDGQTPDEAYFSRCAANRQPRLEPRPRWPRGSPCSEPQAEVRGQPGDPMIIEIDGLEHRRYLPIIRARHAA